MQCLITVSSQLQVPLHTYLLAFCITYSQLMFSQSSLSHLVRPMRKFCKWVKTFLMSWTQLFQADRLAYTWTSKLNTILAIFFLPAYMVGGISLSSAQPQIWEFECLIFSWKSLALFGIYLVNRCLITLLYYRFDKLWFCVFFSFLKLLMWG